MIEIQEKTYDKLQDQYTLIKLRGEETSTDIQKEHVDILLSILNEPEFKEICKKVIDGEYGKDMSFEDLSYIQGTIENVNEKLEEVRRKAEVESFLLEGYTLNKQELYDKFTPTLKKKFPNYNIERLWELYVKPPRELPVEYSKKLKISYDPFVFRKYIIALNQMIYNNMDLIVLFTGPEGSGKSTHCSQHMWLVYWILKEIGIIDYAFDIKNLFFNTLYKFREAEDKYFKQKFRILGLDEGNELHRQNWKDEEVQTFFQRLRRERYNQRIKFICIPVLGELNPNIVLSRANFIFEMQLKNNIKSGTLEKGIVNFYILPRSDYIYSPAQKREIPTQEIKGLLWDKLKDKSYLTGIPRSILIKRIKANGIWGFKEDVYNDLLKESNETFSVKKGVMIKETEAFHLYKSNLTLKKIGIKHNDYRYASCAKFISRLNKYWESDMDLLNKYESIFKRKLEIREEQKNENTDDKDASKADD